jgi:predicted ATPase
MALSDPMRLLDRKWTGGNGWPKRLEWLEVRGIRGWIGQRVPLGFPIVAIVGENGSGKSTLLQAAAGLYRGAHDDDRVWFQTEFFPETAWDTISDASIHYGYMEGTRHLEHTIRKPTSRWLGNPERPKRAVEYIDLSRLQPVGTRVGYARIAKNRHLEATAKMFSPEQVSRLSEVMGRRYDSAKMALSTIDNEREIPVLTKDRTTYSGFHQGSGETTIAELLGVDLPRYGLILIDEIESSLHPRAQRRLMRDLAEQCRTRECQIILTTHSPYVLEELPLQARCYILEAPGTKEIVSGVSPQFAMTKMDDEPHPECEIYVEDERSKTMLNELLTKHAKELYSRCSIVPYGASNLGMALGQMTASGRFRRPTCVFLDGDNDEAIGCILLPGNDAPERAVFQGLKRERWGQLWLRISRDISSVQDSCEKAMLLGDHHDWLQFAANQLMCGSDALWQAMCAEWSAHRLRGEIRYVIDAIDRALT